MIKGQNSWIVVQLIWIGISIAISITLSFLLPFPISLVVTIGIFIAMSYYIRVRAMKGKGIGPLGMTGSMGPGKIIATCTGCGYSHKKRICPRCGSNSVKYL